MYRRGHENQIVDMCAHTQRGLDAHARIRYKVTMLDKSPASNENRAFVKIAIGTAVKRQT